MTPRASSLTFAAGVVAAALGAGSAGASDSISVNLVERGTTDVVIDIGDKGDSAGDILTFSNKLYDEANAAEVGGDNGWCTRTLKGVAWECVFTVTLADGQLTAEGPYLDGKDSTWAVTGGSGKYLKSRGEMQLHARNPEASEFDLKFKLTD